MPNDSQTREHAHELVDRLGPAQIDAVVQLLEVMVEPEEEPLSEEEVQAVTASREHFRHHSEAGVSFDQFAAECGFTMDQIRGRED